MEKGLAEQLQDVIDALLVAQSKAQLATRTMRDRRLYFGLGLNHPDAEIAHLISTMRYTKRLAEQRAKGAPAEEPDRSPAEEVEGRIVSVSEAGDALVAHPVQDATALPGAVSAEAEGVKAASDESVADAEPEPGIIPPAIAISQAMAQPPAVDDAPAASQVTPVEADGLSHVIPPNTDET